jgi:hypothetical protein
MSLSGSQLIGALAGAQGAMVMPAITDGYAGASAGLVAALLMMAAADVEAGVERRAAALLELEALLGAEMPGGVGIVARFDAAMAALERVHERAEHDDPALARRIVDWLAAWTASEIIVPAV